MLRTKQVLRVWSVVWKTGFVLGVLCCLILCLRWLGIGYRWGDASDAKIAMRKNFGQSMRTIAKLRMLRSDEPEKWRDEVDPWGTTMRFLVTAKSCTVYSAGPDREWGTDDDMQASVP